MAVPATLSENVAALAEDLVAGSPVILLVFGVAQRGVTAGVRCRRFDPEPDGTPFLGRGVDVLMPAGQPFEQRTGGAADCPGG